MENKLKYGFLVLVLSALFCCFLTVFARAENLESAGGNSSVVAEVSSGPGTENLMPVGQAMENSGDGQGQKGITNALNDWGFQADVSAIPDEDIRKVSKDDSPDFQVGKSSISLQGFGLPEQEIAAKVYNPSIDFIAGTSIIPKSLAKSDASIDVNWQGGSTLLPNNSQPDISFFWDGQSKEINGLSFVDPSTESGITYKMQTVGNGLFNLDTVKGGNIEDTVQWNQPSKGFQPNVNLLNNCSVRVQVLNDAGSFARNASVSFDDEGKIKEIMFYSAGGTKQGVSIFSPDVRLTAKIAADAKSVEVFNKYQTNSMVTIYDDGRVLQTEKGKQTDAFYEGAASNVAFMENGDVIGGYVFAGTKLITHLP